MEPQLGPSSNDTRSILLTNRTDESYLPAGRAYRVIIAPDSRTSGYVTPMLPPFNSRTLIQHKSIEAPVGPKHLVRERTEYPGSVSLCEQRGAIFMVLCVDLSPVPGWMYCLIGTSISTISIPFSTPLVVFHSPLLARERLVWGDNIVDFPVMPFCRNLSCF